MSLFGREYTCAEILAGGYTGYDYLSVQTNRSGCVESVIREVLITPEEVYEGRCYDGLTDFTYTMTATARARFSQDRLPSRDGTRRAYGSFRWEGMSITSSGPSPFEAESRI